MHAAQQRIPRRLPGKPRVHQCETRLVLEGVRIDMTKPREVDGELESQDARCDFSNICRGFLLLLLLDAGGRSLGFLIVRGVERRRAHSVTLGRKLADHSAGHALRAS